MVAASSVLGRGARLGIELARRGLDRVGASQSPVGQFLAAADQPDGPVRLRDGVHPLKGKLIRAGFELPNQALYVFMHGYKASRVPKDVQTLLDSHHQQLMADDLRYVLEGKYPRELLRFPASEYASVIPDVLNAIPKIVRRHEDNNFQDVPDLDKLREQLTPRLAQLGVTEQGQVDAYFKALEDNWKVYGRTFHWLGWLSDDAAKPYELGVELLFWGTLLPMRRMALAKVVDAVDGIASPAILDLACGRGDFLKDLALTLPHARLTGVDLSPDFLLHAQSQLPDSVRLIPASADHTGLPDNSQNCVVIGYLFHELPPEDRRAVLQEAKRVLKPGGRLIVYDAIQRTDRNAEVRRIAEYMNGFFPASFHEPYFQNYQDDDLQRMLVEAGFIVSPRDQSSHFLTTVVSARKPWSEN